MTALAPTLATFLREHLRRDRRASPHTCDAYAFSFQLLVTFAARRLGTQPSRLEIEQLDVPMILTFLEFLEEERGNTARSRNARLAAIKSFFRFLEYRVPACLDQALRVHAIPMKKFDQELVSTLTRVEIQALLDAPDPRTFFGTRDRAMLHFAFAAGLRVSELVGLTLDQFDARAPASIHVMGKGRRERVLPLWRETTNAIKAWLAVRPSGPDIALFLNGSGRAMTRSGFEYILAKHAGAAAAHQPSINAKKVATRPASQLRPAHAPGHPRYSQGRPVARSRQSSEHGGLSAGGSDREARGAERRFSPQPQGGSVPPTR